MPDVCFEYLPKFGKINVGTAKVSLVPLNLVKLTFNGLRLQPIFAVVSKNTALCKSGQMRLKNNYLASQV